MTTVRAFASRLFGLLTRRRRDIELHDEIQTHLDCLADQHLRRGMSPADARLAARREFGGVDQVKERYRDQRGLRLVEFLALDARYALRTLRRSPGFTAVAVSMLAIGLGVNASVFTVTNAVLFKGIPFIDRSDRVLYIERRPPGPFSYPDFEDWRDRATSFQGMAAAQGWLINLSDQRPVNGEERTRVSRFVPRISGEDENHAHFPIAEPGFPERCAMTVISANGFKLIGQKPVLGRDFTPFDESPGAAPVAILSYGLWERRYGRDPAILGQTIRISVLAAVPVLNGDTATVVGVMAPGFAFPMVQDVWVPLVPTPTLQKRETPSLSFFFGRLVEGVSIKSARAEADTIGTRLASQYPVTHGSVSVENFNEHFVGPRATMMFESMWGAVSCVLLIVCANLANLLLARSMGRSREMSVRMALGAGRWRIIRQFLIESMMLSAMGGICGWWIATLGIRLYEFAGFAPFRFDPYIDFTMDYHVIGYLVAMSMGTGLLFGLAPASTLSKLDINATLKDGGHGALGGERGTHLSAFLVTGEIALAVVLLVGAGVMIRSFLNIYTADLGVNTPNLITSFLALPVAKYPSAEAQISFYDRLKSRLQAIPGIESVAIADRSPADGARRLAYELADAPDIDGQPLPTVSAVIIGPDYFRTMGDGACRP
jgi:predicted permease